MQTKEVVGNITKGTITYKLSIADCGFKDAVAIVDYYMTNKNQYQVYMYLQTIDNDEFITVVDRIINCQYHDLEKWGRQLLNATIQDKSLKSAFKTYMGAQERQGRIGEFCFEPIMLISMSESNCGYNTAVNGPELNKVFNYCKSNGIKKISLHTSIAYRDNDITDSNEAVIMGPVKSIEALFRVLALEQRGKFETEYSYDETTTYINIKMNGCSNKEVINIHISHGNRYMEKELESYFLCSSSKTRNINNFSDAFIEKQYSLADAMELDQLMSNQFGFPVYANTNKVLQRL